MLSPCCARIFFRSSISSSNCLLIGFPSNSFFPFPAAAITWSLSVIHTRCPVLCAKLSAYCPANWLSSPIGEYFLRMISPSRSVKISSGSPSRIRSVLRISFGTTTLPKSSILRTIPVAFIKNSSCFLHTFHFCAVWVVCGKQEELCKPSSYLHF